MRRLAAVGLTLSVGAAGPVGDPYNGCWRSVASTALPDPSRNRGRIEGRITPIGLIRATFALSPRVCDGLPLYPLITPTGRMRATLLDSPASCTTSTTSSTFL